MNVDVKRPAAERLEQTFAEVWRQAYPVLLERLDAIAVATAELSKERPDLARIESGEAEAHRLAGVLGTFGLDRGTQLAKGLEARLHRGCGRSEAREARRLAIELRALLESAGRASS